MPNPSLQLTAGRLKEAEMDPFKEPNQQSYVTKIYRRDIGKRFWVSAELRVAHFLLEHGTLVGDAHFGGSTSNMYVYEKKT